MERFVLLKSEEAKAYSLEVEEEVKFQYEKLTRASTDRTVQSSSERDSWKRLTDL
jgi:hypothetical protein